MTSPQVTRLTAGPPPHGCTPPACTINHPEHGQVAAFYPEANPKPLVSFTALVWGPLRRRVLAATAGKKYGQPGYGLGFDQQLPAGSTLDDALTVVQARLDALDALSENLSSKRRYPG